jgi:polyhydroxybutyrate depolymerase
MRNISTKTVPLVAAMMMMIVGVRTAPAQDAKIMTWTVGSDRRQAIVYAPTAAATGSRAPLVLSFHGHGDNMQNFQHTDLHRAWPEAIVVYFQGLKSGDGLFGWQTERGHDDDRDLKLVDAALASLRGTYAVDESRIYSTGFSNGANFTYLLWAERPAVFAAFAPVAARLRPSVKLAVPKPLFHVAGTQDTQILFADQQHAIDAAKRVDGVTGKGTSCGSGCTVYTSGGADLMTWIHPGGHEYPPTTSERIAQFFRDHQRKP